MTMISANFISSLQRPREPSQRHSQATSPLQQTSQSSSRGPSQMQSQNPPSYPDVQNDEMLERLQTTVRQEQSTTTFSGYQEADRLRNFLIYALSSDYQCYTAASLSSDDWEHFANINHCLQVLRDTHDHLHLNSCDRANLGPFFWRFLHEPCTVLGIPLECVTISILRFFKFCTQHGPYKGSFFGVAHTYGLTCLAQKLWVDRNILIPAVIKSPALQQLMMQRIGECAMIYFQKVPGLEGSTHPGNNRRGWAQVQNVIFSLNERGRAYENSRTSALQTCMREAGLSLRHWTFKMELVLNGLKQRAKNAQKRISDEASSWKSPTIDLTQRKPAERHLWKRPYGWQIFTSQHVPDMFEHRPAKDSTDA